jgi:hypothetical protein
MASTRISMSVVPTLRGICGAAALIGLFAMHGLAAHGSSHTEHVTEPMVMVAAGHDHPLPATDHAAADLTVSGPLGDSAPDPGLLVLAGMCLAVLLAGVVLAVLLGRRVAVQGYRDRGSGSSGWPRRSRRDRDPPSVLALSVQRC